MSSLVTYLEQLHLFRGLWTPLKSGVHIIHRVMGKRVHVNSFEVLRSILVILQVLSFATLQSFKLVSVHSVIALSYLYHTCTHFKGTTSGTKTPISLSAVVHNMNI